MAVVRPWPHMMSPRSTATFIGLSIHRIGVSVMRRNPTSSVLRPSKFTRVGRHADAPGRGSTPASPCPRKQVMSDHRGRYARRRMRAGNGLAQRSGARPVPAEQGPSRGALDVQQFERVEVVVVGNNRRPCPASTGARTSRSSSTSRARSNDLAREMLPWIPMSRPVRCFSARTYSVTGALRRVLFAHCVSGSVEVKTCFGMRSMKLAKGSTSEVGQYPTQ